jgi:hypothetical protein
MNDAFVIRTDLAAPATTGVAPVAPLADPLPGMGPIISRAMVAAVGA